MPIHLHGVTPLPLARGVCIHERTAGHHHIVSLLEYAVQNSFTWINKVHSLAFLTVHLINTYSLMEFQSLKSFQSVLEHQLKRLLDKICALYSK